MNIIKFLFFAVNITSLINISSAQIVNYALYLNTASCTDSDGGFYPNVPGTINLAGGPYFYSDINNNGQFNDICLDNQILREGVCGTNINPIYSGYFGTFDTDCFSLGKICRSNAFYGVADNCILDFCGTGVCGHNENLTTCQPDCPGICGDGLCNNFFEDSQNCSLDCPASQNYWLLFVTSNFITGLIGVNESDALANADSICQNEATARGYAGNFKAWLSTSSVNATDRIFQGGFVGETQQIIAYNKADLLDGSLANAINNSNSVNYGVWTGTTFSGIGSYSNYRGTSANCNDWTNNSNYGAYGDFTDRTSGWTHVSNMFSCSFQKNLYCFQVW